MQHRPSYLSSFYKLTNLMTKLSDTTEVTSLTEEPSRRHFKKKTTSNTPSPSHPASRNRIFIWRSTGSCMRYHDNVPRKTTSTSATIINTDIMPEKAFIRNTCPAAPQLLQEAMVIQLSQLTQMAAAPDWRVTQIRGGLRSLDRRLDRWQPNPASSHNAAAHPHDAAHSRPPLQCIAPSPRLHDAASRGPPSTSRATHTPLPRPGNAAMESTVEEVTACRTQPPWRGLTKSTRPLKRKLHSTSIQLVEKFS